MPSRPPRPCAYKGCPALTHQRYCNQHAAMMVTRDTRPTAARRGYNAEWRRIRDEVLIQEPYCRICRSRPSVDVDHIVPLSRGGSHDRCNLQGLCISCHRRKTRNESLGRGVIH